MASFGFPYLTQNLNNLITGTTVHPTPQSVPMENKLQPWKGEKHAQWRSLQTTNLCNKIQCKFAKSEWLEEIWRVLNDWSIRSFSQPHTSVSANDSKWLSGSKLQSLGKYKLSVFDINRPNSKLKMASMGHVDSQLIFKSK